MHQPRHRSVDTLARRLWLVAAVGALAVAAAPRAEPAITIVLPSVVLGSPSDVSLDQTQSDTDIVAFERGNASSSNKISWRIPMSSRPSLGTS